MEKTILIIAVVIGALLYLGLSLSTPQPSVEPPVTEVEQEQLIETGRFVFEQGGVPIVEEEYMLFFSPQEGYMLVSQATLSIREQEIKLAQQYQFDRGFMPFFYQLGAETPSGSQIISAQLGLEGLHMEVQAGTAHQVADVPDARNAVILDNNLMSHFLVLIMAAEAGAIEREFTAAVPQALLTLPSTLQEPREVTFTSAGMGYQGVLYRLQMGDILIDAVVYEGKLVGLFNRAQAVVGYAPQRFPEGISLEQLPDEVSPLPSGVRERTVTFKSKKITLAGTLTLPEGAAESVPGVLFIHGSGPVDRNENAPGMAINVFRELAHALAQVGVGSLRYDKRGVGESGGSFEEASRDDLLADADAALGALRSAREIDPDRSFLLGHSEGGYLASALAAGDPDLAGLILVASAARSLADVTRWQVETLAQMRGLSGEEIAEALAQEDQFIEFVKGSTGEWEDYTFEELTEAMPWLTESKAEEIRRPFSLAWLREHYLQDPVESLRRISCPVLVIHGEKDLQVPPSEAASIVAVLEEAGNTDVTVHVFPDLNHLLRHHPEPPSLAFRHFGEPVDPRVVEAITDWVVGQSVTE
jgi:pimeloyl-ACP methyl ester carboxylesterase